MSSTTLDHYSVIDRMTDIVACLNSSDSIQRFLLDIHCILQKVTYADNFYVVLVDDNAQLSFPYFHDVKDNINADKLEGLTTSDLKNSLTAYALSSKKVCNFNEDDIHTLIEQHEVKILGSLPRQWLCFPLRRRDTFLGAFVIQSYRNENEYPELIVDILNTISHVISSALDAFNTQRALIDANFALKQIQNHLEEKVSERTYQLEASLSELRSEIMLKESLQKQLEYDSSHDSLTQLANRKRLFDELEKLSSKSKRTAVSAYLIYIDLDNFKPVNDTFGHPVGDEVLIEVAKRLSACVREYDTVARIGGDEFVILIEHAFDRSEMEVIAKRVIDSIAKPITTSRANVNISASMGIAATQNQHISPEQLINFADAALYQVKRTDKGRYHFATTS